MLVDDEALFAGGGERLRDAVVLVRRVLTNGVVDGLCRIIRVYGDGQRHFAAFAVAVIAADFISGGLFDGGVEMGVLGQQGLVGIVPTDEVGSGGDIVGKVSGERAAVGGGGHLRGGGHNVLGGHGRHTRALTTGGFVVALHIAGAGGVLVAVEGHGVAVARRRDGGGGGVVVPAALRGVRSVNGGQDHLASTAAAVALGGDRRDIRHFVHGDAHQLARTLAVGVAVVA